MLRNLSDSECKEIIIRLAKRLKVEPKLITTRLMSEDDKNDMRYGNLLIKALDCHIKVWIENGMCDYTHGKTIPLADEKQQAVLI